MSVPNQFPGQMGPDGTGQNYLGDPLPQHVYPPPLNYPISPPIASALDQRMEAELQARLNYAMAQERQVMQQERAEMSARMDQLQEHFKTLLSTPSGGGRFAPISFILYN
jgi:hypothetical protein